MSGVPVCTRRPGCIDQSFLPYQVHLMIKLPIAVTALLMAACSATPISAKVNYTPIVYRQVSGTRPFVNVLMNGKPFLLMVHANAKLFAQTIHANAATIGLANLTKTSNYGITADGKVSPLGRAKATLATLQVGGSLAANVPLSVFEIPQDVAKTDGMLGIDWLVGQRIIVDFALDRLGVADTIEDAQTEDKHLLDQGYVGHRMTWDPTVRGYYVMGTIDGVPARLGVSTVGENVIDLDFIHRSGIANGPAIGDNGGPEGATTPVTIPRHQVLIVVDGQLTAPSQPWVYDLYAYSSKPRPTTSHDEAYLGAEFMLANQAVVDFATGTLFLPPAKSR